ncbi:DnaJ (Hsp40), sub C, member 28, variant 3 [Schistosoma haematobium]|nr:DnaJ (Hsp40), sub C, member 28, variant 3 [Schistosoma haematobium]KAH9591376.1 DnaJ (Hsp40), sub C, member 28, variant 3 [Schistosoma haematobium]
MNHGEFNNLSGQGRPIDYDKNPHVFGDSTDKRLNQLMANQGFLPKWVLLNKEVNSRWNIAIDKLNSIYNVESNLHSSIWSEACKLYNRVVCSSISLLAHVEQVILASQSEAFRNTSRNITLTGSPKNYRIQSKAQSSSM